MSVMQEVFLTEKDIMARYHKSRSTVARWRQTKKSPPFIKIEGSVLYPLSELEEYERQARNN